MGAKFTADRTKRHEYANGAVGFPSCWGALQACPLASVYFCPIDGTPLALTCYATGSLMRCLDGVTVPARTKHRGQFIGGTLKTDPLGNVRFIPSPAHIQRLKATHETKD